MQIQRQVVEKRRFLQFFSTKKIDIHPVFGEDVWIFWRNLACTSAAGVLRFTNKGFWNFLFIVILWQKNWNLRPLKIANWRQKNVSCDGTRGRRATADIFLKSEDREISVALKWNGSINYWLTTVRSNKILQKTEKVSQWQKWGCGQTIARFFGKNFYITGLFN